MIFGSSGMGIGLAITLRNNFSAQANRINSQFNQLYGNATRIQAANLRAIRDASAGVAVAGVVATKGLSNAYKAAADFDFVMRTIQAVTGASTKEFKQMDAMILELGTNSIYTIDQVGSAMEYLVRSGFNANQAMRALPGVVNLGAASGGASIGGKGGIADIMAAIMKEFNLGAEQSTRVADLLAKAANISSSDVTDLGQAFKYAAGNAHSMGLEIEPVLAMLTTISNAGLKGGVAGRGLNAMLSYLNRAASSFRTNRQLDAFKAIGLTKEDLVTAQGELKPMIEILDTFGKKLKGMGKVEASGALSALFMMRGERTMLPLLQKSLKIGYDFAGNLEQIMSNSSDYAKRIGEYLMEGPKGSIMRLEDTWQAFKIKAGKALQPVIEPLLKGLISLLSKLVDFVQTPLGKTMVYLAAGLAVAATVGGTLLATFAAIRLATMGGMVTIANMGKTLVWAWTSAAAAAMRYRLVSAGVAPNATWVGKGVYTAPGMRGFQKVGSYGATGAAGAAGGRLVGILGRVGTALSTFGGHIVKLAGPIGWFVSILGLMFGFGNILKSIIWVLGSFGNALWTAADYVKASFSGKTYAQVASDYERRQKSLNSMFDKGDDGIISKPKQVFNKKQDQDFVNSLHSKQAMDSAKAKGLAIYMDGKKVGETLDSRDKLSKAWHELTGATN